MTFPESLKSEFEEFFTALSGEDDLGAVIRVHIRLEYQLNEFIRKSLPVPQRFEKASLEFTQTLDIALALGLSEDLGPPLKALAALRNRFAHRLGMQLDQASLKNIYDTLSTSDKQMVQNLFQHMRVSEDRLNEFTKLIELHERDQFTLIATILWSRLAAHVATYAE